MRVLDVSASESLPARREPGLADLPRRGVEGVVVALRQALQAWVPGRLGLLARRARAEARALALTRVPLPLYEVWKLGSLDPFVPRATSLSFRTSGKHFVLLCDAPMGDGGGDRRSAQIALELLNRAHRVTYVHRFWPKERGRRRRTFAHENLTLVSFAEFSARRFARERASAERVVVLAELPLPEYLACARYLKAHGAQTAYDCTEEWAAEPKAGWYSARTEDSFVRESDLVVASARALKDGLEGRSWREVALVPNAVNARLYARSREHPRPLDLPRSSAVFLYLGGLRDDWFDWGWITALARARPDAAVVLVGEYSGQCKGPPRNLHFLGVKPQADLPAYVAHADVCLIPYRADRLARSLSPVRVFEYLAMGKPVVVSDLPELAELPGVRVARNEAEFVAQVAQAQGASLPAEDVARLVSENSWKARVRRLERLLGV